MGASPGDDGVEQPYIYLGPRGDERPGDPAYWTYADPYAVMRRMGHSSIKVTYDTYGHLLPERDAEITARLDDLCRRAGVDSLWTQGGEARSADGPI
ncbi:MAG TPA: hypothetical protein VHE80_04910 [Acidimicrobiales bacterium]|nr:hypothetical protein [Acidimicrobiales bacterium]